MTFNALFFLAYSGKSVYHTLEYREEFILLSGSIKIFSALRLEPGPKLMNNLQV